MRSLRALILTITAGLVIACTDSRAPTDPSGESPSVARFGQGTAEHARHEELKKLLQAEKERLQEQKELQKSQFEAARLEWKAYRRELKQAMKLSKNVFNVALLRCEPRPFEGEAAILGPEGGTLHIGEHELVIPPGALAEEVVIVGEAPTSSLVAVEFSPEGLTFQRPAELSLSYKHCDVPADTDLRLAYLGPGNRILELPASSDLPELSDVVGEINHFSRYAVAY